MQERPRRRDNERHGKRKVSTFGPMAEAAAAYVRSRDLPRLIPLWRHELGDHSPEGCRRVLAKLRSALRAERSRALLGHWSYDLNRHLGLISAYKGELARLSPARGSAELHPSRQGHRRNA